MIGRRAFLAGAAALGATRAHAKTEDLVIARQTSLGHLPLIVMQEQRLLEKEAAARGLAGLKPRFITLGGGSAMNDALLSGAVHFVAGGVPPLVLLWSKTRGTVKGVAAMNSMPLQLNTTNPRVRSLRDFTEADKIALPAVKVSVQAIFLQMAAERQFGPEHRFDLDKWTVSLSHPDGMAAMFAGQVTGHFTASPFQELERRRPGVHKVLDTFEVLGAPSTFNVVWATAAFVERNPLAYASFTAALGKAIAAINADKRAAAAIYAKASNEAADAGLIAEILADPRNIFTTTPQSIGSYVDFMASSGLIKQRAASWKDLFFADAAGEPGN